MSVLIKYSKQMAELVYPPLYQSNHFHSTRWLKLLLDVSYRCIEVRTIRQHTIPIARAKLYLPQQSTIHSPFWHEISPRNKACANVHAVFERNSVYHRIAQSILTGCRYKTSVFAFTGYLKYPWV